MPIQQYQTEVLAEQPSSVLQRPIKEDIPYWWCNQGPWVRNLIAKDPAQRVRGIIQSAARQHAYTRNAKGTKHGILTHDDPCPNRTSKHNWATAQQLHEPRIATIRQVSTRCILANTGACTSKRRAVTRQWRIRNASCDLAHWPRKYPSTAIFLKTTSHATRFAST